MNKWKGTRRDLIKSAAIAGLGATGTTVRLKVE